MLHVKTYVAPSRVHGNGLFLVEPVNMGDILYGYHPFVDVRIPLDEATDRQKHFGYVNPLRPGELVVCGDDARWWNFPPEGIEPNSVEDLANVRWGEHQIFAAHDMPAGTELLITKDSDLDAGRKLSSNT